MTLWDTYRAFGPAQREMIKVHINMNKYLGQELYLCLVPAWIVEYSQILPFKSHSSTLLQAKVTYGLSYMLHCSSLALNASWLVQNVRKHSTLDSFVLRRAQKSSPALRSYGSKEGLFVCEIFQIKGIKRAHIGLLSSYFLTFSILNKSQS